MLHHLIMLAVARIAVTFFASSYFDSKVQEKSSQ